MELLPDDLKKTLPALRTQTDPDKMAYAKFAQPALGWTFYAIEGQGDGEDFVFFGCCISSREPKIEWGFLVLRSLVSRQAIRDEHFTPTLWSAIETKHFCQACRQLAKGEMIELESAVTHDIKARLFTPSPDCDFLDCMMCERVFHHRCCQYPDSGHCDACITQFDLLPELIEQGLIAGV